MRNTFLMSISFAVLGALCTLQAGPPLICHPYDIGTASSLPWSHNAGWNDPDPSYNVKNLAADTLAILDRNAPVLVRMETMRRAVLYGAKDHEAARALLSQLAARASSNPALPALFDYGYLLSSLNQVSWLYKEDLSAGINGYDYVKKALALDPDSAELNFAAALMTTGPARDQHLAQARASKPSALLSQNLTTHR